MTAPRFGARFKAPDGAAMRFLAAAVTYEGSECLIWPFATASGYGRIVVGGKPMGAHRMVLMAWDGPCPPKHEALHACDVRACVNPLHLRWGTRQANVDDMVGRCRHWSQTWQRP